MNNQTKKIPNRPRKRQRASGKEIQVRLKWAADSELQTIYVNHMLITSTGPEFYVVFGELVTPSITDEANLPEELEITPKVRLVMSPDAMKKIAAVMNDFTQKRFGQEAK